MSLRRMLRVLLGAAMVTGLIFSAGPATARPRHAPRPIIDFAIPGDAVFPEGVAADPRTGFFYAGSSSDGTIFRGSPDRSTMEVFLPGGADGRTGATGMKVDRQGRLYVSGAATGQMWVYDTRTRALIRHFDTGLRANTFINDVTITPNGDAFFTDSLTPVLWRVPAAAVRRAGAGIAAPERFLDFTGTAVVYQAGFNLNGIWTAAGGRQLVTIQSNTGKLFRIGVRDRDVAEVPVAGGPLTNGDGILLAGPWLFVARNANELIVTVALDSRLRDGRVVAQFTDEALRFPTTMALEGTRLLVVNSQFDRRGGTPELPFTVSSVPLEQVLGWDGEGPEARS
jgi:Cu-Zn family superoxide dismutase